MPPVFTHEKQYTIDDIYALPDGKRAELIDGQLYYMAPPNTKQQRILSFLHLEIGNYIRENKEPVRFSLLLLLCFSLQITQNTWNRISLSSAT